MKDQETHLKNLNNWYEADKKNQLRTTYNFNADSVVFDAGAYFGDWGIEMHDKYDCHVYCFEPVQSIFSKLKPRMKPKMKALQYAIGGTTRSDTIYVNKDGSSMVYKSKQPEKIQVKSITDVLTELGIEQAAMLKMNIECSEYEVMERLIDESALGVFDTYQIQFHRDIEGYVERRQKIREELSKTHSEDYNFDFVWESWSRKGI